MKKTLKLIAAFIYSAFLAFGNASCESKTPQNDSQYFESHMNDKKYVKDESQNDADYIKRIRKLADKGDAIAQFRIGYFFENGQNGLSQSNEEAKKWYLKSAQQGLYIAQYHLASIYFTEENDNESFQWMKKCAETGAYPYAQFMLGDFYLHGIGCSPNIEKGLFWLDKAAEQGVEEAIEELNEIREEIKFPTR